MRRRSGAHRTEPLRTAPSARGLRRFLGRLIYLVSGATRWNVTAMSGARRTGPARERLLAAASRLFYAHGMTATGIDAVTAEAGGAKMSLYNNFSSKEELMRAYSDARHRERGALVRARAAEAAAPTA